MTARADEVVVTGLGAVTPLGLSVAETWDGLVAGRSGVGCITAFEASDLPVRIAAEVRGFDAEAVMGAKRARRSARFSQFAVAAAREAVADAGLDVAAAADRVGVIVNSAVGGAPETQWAVEALVAGGPRDVSATYVPSTIPNMPACEVAIDVSAHGPVSASALACASGNYALLEARRLILAGEADVVIAGGTDAGIGKAMIAGLANMGPLSQRNGEPERASRPFDADRDGFVYGEGAVLLVLESAAHARDRGARVYGSVAGGALTSDAFHISAPEPSGTYAARAIEQALARSGTRPEEVDYICAHGTGTRANDVTETRAIRAAFGAAADAVAVSSPKSMVGHMIAAAGSLSALASLLAMRDGVIPPTVNLEAPDPECDLDHVALRSRRADVRTAVVNAFGFGGQNCVVVLRAPSPDP
ncbi:beta-ketoacyl-[acyl-carrier-protein] synthase family protein [Capillimicrobium parvum]|uniref:3-oxoacyl-[acyl-carrier-protein] synthase 2 n=1 Tax=Capillimicrobium parvum TaxID=2884022 RepID=A0A9E6Y1J8_9ACTN|nr:beta-ketoacyl-ACP synthase II [Capillimicrobium parvum]UGS38058.1 3-oxoacyl-[acyl-carrier-protein] synthase 2 [Capillimicrobium parvum]